MISYTGVDEFSESNVYDTTDFVLGGTGGTSNEPLKALFNRTEWLKNRVSGIEDVKFITGNYTWDIADALKAFVFSITDNATFQLPDVTQLRPGHLVHIITRYTAIKALSVVPFGSQLINEAVVSIINPNGTMYMHGGERLILLAANDHWEIYSAEGNFFTAGETFGAFRQMKNTAILNGSTFNRADMPRVRDFALQIGGALVSDTTWLSDPGSAPVYRGCFSSGNGTSTMRLPDHRGLFDRYLDLSRGLDSGRLFAFAGGLELDDFKQHNHKWKFIRMQSADTFSARDMYVYVYNPTKSNVNVINTSSLSGADTPLEATGGSETRPKNIGKIPLIRY